MSDSEGGGKRLPGNFRVDPAPPPAGGLTIDGALDELQRRRKRVPAKVGNGAAPPAAAAEPPREPAREPAAEPDDAGELPSPFTDPDHGEHDPGEEAEQTDDPDAEGDADGGEPDEPAQAGAFTVMVDGKPQQVPVAELIAGYMRGTDYTRKTQAVTAQHKQFAEAYDMFTRGRQELEQRLARYTTETAKEFDEPTDWIKLAQTDPMAWAEKRARYDALLEAQNQQKGLAELRAQEDLARKRQMVQAGNQVLVRAIPGWKDAATRSKLQDSIKEYAMSIGYTAEELSSDIVDPRQIMVLHDAMTGKQMQSRRVTPQPPSRQPTLDRGGTTPPSQPTQRQRDAEKAFATNKSVDNALAVIKARQARRTTRH